MKMLKLDSLLPEGCMKNWFILCLLCLLQVNLEMDGM